MTSHKNSADTGPVLNYPNDRHAGRWREHVGTRPSESADYDGSSTLVRRSWFGRLLARKAPPVKK
jgi:hypothetical protein